MTLASGYGPRGVPALDAELEAAGVTVDPGTSLPSVRTSQQVAVFVYQGPLRLWHWVNFLVFVTLCLTGYLIGSPPPSVGGEAYDHFLFGYIRFAHFAAGQIFAFAFLGRIVWAFSLGNRYSREIFVIPVWNPRWWHELWYELKWYLFLSDRTVKYLGHNPLAQISMFFLFVLPAFLMIFTGLALYGEGAQAGHWAHFFLAPALDVFGSSMMIHTIHHIGMWVMICFFIVHLYVAVRKDILSGATYLSTIVNGWRIINFNKN